MTRKRTTKARKRAPVKRRRVKRGDGYIGDKIVEYQRPLGIIAGVSLLALSGALPLLYENKMNASPNYVAYNGRGDPMIVRGRR